MHNEQKNPRSQVIIEAFGVEDDLIEKIIVGYDEYYNESSQLIDDGQYRAARGVKRIVGKVYDSRRRLQSEFVNRYRPDGSYAGGKTVHLDGTVTED